MKTNSLRLRSFSLLSNLKGERVRGNTEGEIWKDRYVTPSVTLLTSVGSVINVFITAEQKYQHGSGSVRAEGMFCARERKWPNAKHFNKAVQ